MNPGKVFDIEQLEPLGKQLRFEGQKIVWTNGCFDLIHPGHIRSLQSARALGDILIVGINSDASVRRLKGPSRPIFPQDQRAEVLSALACVDYVVIFDEATPEAMLARLRPHIHCKGEDYSPQGLGKAIPEAKLVEAYGGQVVFLPLIPELSTSALIARIRELPP